MDPPPQHFEWCFFFSRVQAEHVPLEDELEALCRLHAARAELVLSGDLESFIGVASTVEAFPFRKEADSEDEGEPTDFSPPPAMFAFSLSAGDGGGGDGGAERAQERLDDGRRRRLGALENCLDAFDRLVDFFCAGFQTELCVALPALRTLRTAANWTLCEKPCISLSVFFSTCPIVRCRDVCISPLLFR